VAYAHGKDSYFAVEDSAATTLRAIVGIKTITFGQENELADITIIGDEGRKWRQGLTNGTIQITGLWENTASTGSHVVLQSLVGIEVTTGFEYGPQGNTSTNVKLSGECVLASFETNTDVGDMVLFTATFNIHGDVTLGTFT
jgi:predicted secreted protein